MNDSGGGRDELLHELHVHEAELQVQNEELRRIRDELQRARDRYAMLYDFAPVGYVTLDERGRITSTNLAFGTMLGVPRAQIKGLFSGYLAPDSLGRFMRHLDAMRKSGTKQRLEAELRRPDDRGVWVLVEVAPPVQTEKDGPREIRLTITDITRRRQAEQELRRAHEQAASVARFPEENPDPVVRIGADGTLLYANAAAREALGEWSIATGRRIPGAWRERVDEALRRHRRYDTEITHAGRTWLCSVIPVGDEYVNVYARDITDRKQSEEALAESETRSRRRAEQLRTMMDAAPAIIWMAHDAECRRISGNRAAYRFLRTPVGVNLSKTGDEVDKLMHYRILHEGKELAPREMPIQRVAATGETLTDYDIDFVFDDGTVRSLMGNVSPLGADDGGTEGAIGVVVDITDRTRAERALVESEERYRTLFETMTEGFALHEIICDETGNPRDYRFLHVNPAFERLTGLRADDVLGRTVLDVMPRTETLWIERYGEVAMTGMPESFEAYNGPLDRWFEVSVFQTEPGRFAAVFMDVSERKRAEEALRQAHDQLEEKVEERTAQLQMTVQALADESQRLDAFFAHSLTPLVFLDCEFNFIRVNRAYADSCGMAVSDFPGRNHFELYPNEENEAIFREVVRSKRPHVAVAKPFEFPDHPEWGVTYWNWTLVPITNDDEVEFLVFSLEDVTEEVRAKEALQQRADQLQKLTVELAQVEQKERDRLASVLHDGLQQMLAGAKFHVGMLRGKTGDDVVGLLEQLDGLLGESIQTSRTLAYDLSPPILLDQGLAAGIEWLANWYRRHHGLDVDVVLDAHVQIAEGDVRLVFYNALRELLFNIVKHAAVKSARIEMTRAGSDDLEVSVVDDGRGFETGTPGDERGPAEGFGLLNIRERLMALGGEVRLESTPGEGTRVTLVLRPSDRVTLQTGETVRVADVRREPERLDRKEAGGGQAPGVLLVDDHEVMREGLTALLLEHGIPVVGHAADGESAVELASQLRPEVIVMDINLPGIDGVEATRRIHDEHPDIRIIGLSMFTEGPVAHRMKEAGASAFLYKGCPSEELIQAIDRAVCRRGS